MRRLKKGAKVRVKSHGPTCDMCGVIDKTRFYYRKIYNPIPYHVLFDRKNCPPFLDFQNGTWYAYGELEEIRDNI